MARWAEQVKDIYSRPELRDVSLSIDTTGVSYTYAFPNYYDDGTVAGFSESTVTAHAKCEQLEVLDFNNGDSNIIDLDVSEGQLTRPRPGMNNGGGGGVLDTGSDLAGKKRNGLAVEGRSRPNGGVVKCMFRFRRGVRKVVEGLTSGASCRGSSRQRRSKHHQTGV